MRISKKVQIRNEGRNWPLGLLFMNRVSKKFVENKNQIEQMSNFSQKMALVLVQRIA
jgi:uncharacterized membrane protein